MDDAGDVIAWAVFAIVLVLLVAGARDVSFYLSGQQTLTDYLRAHPAWFWKPLAGLLAFALLLGLHLFLEPLFYSK